MTGWWPKGSPHEQRKLDQYADWEIRACIDFAAGKIATEGGDTPEARRLRDWSDRFRAELDDRVQVRADIAPVVEAKLARTSASGGKDPLPSPGGPQ